MRRTMAEVGGGLIVAGSGESRSGRHVPGMTRDYRQAIKDAYLPAAVAADDNDDGENESNRKQKTRIRCYILDPDRSLVSRRPASGRQSSAGGCRRNYGSCERRSAGRSLGPLLPTSH